MNLTVVDAFTDRPFSGNPAAVAVLEQFPPDDRMQAVAREMNLSETAFVVPGADDGHWDLRWFTPATEVDLCGHATLASAAVLDRPCTFYTRSGPLSCRRTGAWIEMDFPAWDVAEAALPAGLPDGIAPPLWTGAAADDWLLELATPADVIEARPDLAAVAAQGRRAFIVTARAGQEGAVGAAAPGVPPGADFVSRVFAPNAGIPEDPVTGSAHCALGPYWAARLGGDELVGYQASARGGTVRIRIAGEGVAPGRLGIAGQAVAVSEVKLLV